MIDTIARFAVPYFFVVSGFLFGKKILIQNNKKEYFKNYFIKIVKLVIYWHLFYFAYGLILEIIKAFIKGLDIRKEIVNYIGSFLGVKEIILFIIYGRSSGPASHHLWYLTALVQCIILIYFFIKFKRLNFLLMISLLLNFIGIFGQTYSGIFNLEFLNYSIPTRDAVFYGLFYTTLGSYIALNYKWIKGKIDNVKSSTFVLLIFLFLSTQILERAIANMFWKIEIRGVDFYISTIFLTISLFLFVIKNNHIGKQSVLSIIGKNAVGIYVSHTLFIDLTSLFFSIVRNDIRESSLFQLAFTPLILITAYFFYILLQSVKRDLQIMFRNKKSLYSVIQRIQERK